MTPPLIAWAAVAPDAGEPDVNSVRITEDAAWCYLRRDLSTSKERIARAGWRVVRVRIIAADAERRVRAAVLEEAAAHFDVLAADIGAFSTDRVATIIRAMKEKPHVG